MFLSGECNLLGSFSSHQKFEAMDIKILSTSQLLDIPCYSSRFLDRPCYSYQISVTAPCYSSVLFRKQQENTSSRHEGMPTQRHRGERERPGPLAALFIGFPPTPPPPGPALCKSGQPGVLFVLPRASLWSPDLPLFYFCRLSPSLSFNHRYFGLLFPILPT